MGSILDKIIESLKTIFDFLLATLTGLAIFYVIFTGIIALGYGIGYFEKMFPEQKLAWIIAYTVEYILMALESILLIVYYYIHFEITVKSIWHHRR